MSGQVALIDGVTTPHTLLDATHRFGAHLVSEILEEFACRRQDELHETRKGHQQSEHSPTLRRGSSLQRLPSSPGTDKAAAGGRQDQLHPLLASLLRPTEEGRREHLETELEAADRADLQLVSGCCLPVLQRAAETMSQPSTLPPAAAAGRNHGGHAGGESGASSAELEGFCCALLQVRSIRFGWNLLHLAAACGMTAMVKALLVLDGLLLDTKLGAVLSYSGDTALHIALTWDATASAIEILRHTRQPLTGPRAMNAAGHTPLELCMSYRVRDALRNEAHSFDVAIVHCAQDGRAESAARAVRNGFESRKQKALVASELRNGDAEAQLMSCEVVVIVVRGRPSLRPLPPLRPRPRPRLRAASTMRWRRHAPGPVSRTSSRLLAVCGRATLLSALMPRGSALAMCGAADSDGLPRCAPPDPDLPAGQPGQARGWCASAWGRLNGAIRSES